jgi:SAM-dependent methyltransferase
MPTVTIPVPLPGWLYTSLKRIKQALFGQDSNGLDLTGDREIEFSFIAAHLPPGPGRALDFGCGPGFLSQMAARRGYQVTAIDLQPQRFLWEDAAVRFQQGNVLTADLPKNFFDVVINCSTVEHVGLSGRYGVDSTNANGDLTAMSRLAKLLRPGGVMLLTVPCGQDAVLAPLHRVYGAERLPRLLAPMQVQKELYWVKNAENRWVSCSRDAALAFKATANYREPWRSSYALGCFVLVAGQ